MPKYLVVATYSPEGMKGVLREGGSERRKMIADMAKNLGGELESFYYAFGVERRVQRRRPAGQRDRRGHGRAHLRRRQVRCSVTVLVTPEEMDKAARTKMYYRPPGA